MGLFPFTASFFVKFVLLIIYVISLCFCGEVAKDCESGKLDLVIILDTSKSVGEENFPRCIHFIVKLLTTLPVEPDLVRVALVRYSSEAQVVSYLNQNMAIEEKIKDVLRIEYIKGSTYTNLALRITNLEVLTPVKGDRSDVSDLVILITDGESSDPSLTMEETEVLKQRAKLKIFTIGVGDEVHEDELQAIATDFAYSVSVGSFTGLAGLIHNMTTMTCTESTKADRMSYDELPKDIFYSDHMMSIKNMTTQFIDRATQSSSQVTQSIGQVTQTSGQFIQSADKVTQTSGQVTQSSGKFNQSIGQVPQSTGWVTHSKATQSSVHITQSSELSSQSSGQVIQSSAKLTQSSAQATQPSAQATQPSAQATQSSGTVTQSSGQATQSSGQATQSSGQATQSSGQATQSSGQATQSSGQVTQESGQVNKSSSQVTESSVENSKTIGTAIETDGTSTSSHFSVTVPSRTWTETQVHNSSLGGVRAATFLTYLGISTAAFVSMLGAVTFIAVLSRKKCARTLSTEL